jgi:hypothetical protein
MFELVTGILFPLEEFRGMQRLWEVGNAQLAFGVVAPLLSSFALTTAVSVYSGFRVTRQSILRLY